MKPRLRWRREPNETGLRAVGQGERGYDLMYGDECIGRARPLTRGWRTGPSGYYWHARAGGLLRNTAGDPGYATVDEAKAACMAWVKERLAQ